MERKPHWKTSTRHSFDMSEYIYGERFVIGGRDYDLEDKQEEIRDEKRKDADEKSFSAVTHQLRPSTFR